MAGEIERRLLVNYRVDPAALADLLPRNFRPQLVDGYAVAGMCLIRLGSLRPKGLPAFLGVTTENAAHRIAVEWDEDGATRSGVFIPRRDTGSRLTTLLGGRLFPGTHHRARFDVIETPDRLHVAFHSTDDALAVDVTVRVEPALTGSQLFATVDAASAFFERGSVGFSPGRDPSQVEAVRLSTNAWKVDPCVVESSRSSFFDDARRFGAGVATLDCALVMRKVPVEWDALSNLATSS
ncbi:MAG: DUF2071 domain-containing protein [Mycobacteriaceae bacterium]